MAHAGVEPSAKVREHCSDLGGNLIYSVDDKAFSCVGDRQNMSFYEKQCRSACANRKGHECYAFEGKYDQYRMTTECQEQFLDFKTCKAICDRADECNEKGIQVIHYAQHGKDDCYEYDYKESCEAARCNKNTSLNLENLDVDGAKLFCKNLNGTFSKGICHIDKCSVNFDYNEKN